MFEGSIVALVTPMERSGAVDYNSLIQLVDWHIASGTSAIVAVGTTGESATLSLSEHLMVVETVVDRVSGKIPVIAGNGSSSTDKAINLTKQMKSIGVDACLCVTPYYNRPTQEGLFQHFVAIADCDFMPQILYNVPARTGVELEVNTILRLASHTNISALKEANSSTEKLRELIALVGDKLDLLSGDDNSCREFISMGAKGVISVTANILPKRMTKLCQAAQQGNRELYSILDQQLAEIHRMLGVESNPIPVKWALSKMGKIVDSIRLPLLTLSEKHQVTMENILKKLDITLI